MDLISVLAIFGLSLVLSILLVPVFMHYAPALGLVDEPDGGRKIHSQVIPRTGGLAIACATLVPTLTLIQESHYFPALLVSVSVIILFGTLDDRKNLDYRWKFLGQILTCVFFLSWIPVTETPLINDWLLPIWATYILLFLFLIGAINAINLADGLDGLAAGIMVLTLSATAYLAYQADLWSIAVFNLALCAALLGFLRYNTYPATVFMGDTGSQFIGFCAAASAIFFTQSIDIETTAHSTYSIMIPIVLLGLPILDTLLVMIVRLYGKSSPFKADNNHIHHQLMQCGMSHRKTVAVIYLIHVGYIALAIFLRNEQSLLILGIYAAYSMIVLALFFGMQRFTQAPINTISTTENTKPLERRRSISRKLTWLHFYGPKTITLFLVVVWLILSFTASHNDKILSYSALIALILAVFGKFLFRFHYRGVRTRIAAYSVAVLCFYPFWAASHTGSQTWLMITLLDVFLALLLVLSMRASRKEFFSLDNMDILILILLSGGGLILLLDVTNIGYGSMLFHLAVTLYSIEFLLSVDFDNRFLLYFPSIIGLIALIPI